jgi:NTE family protein
LTAPTIREYTPGEVTRHSTARKGKKNKWALVLMGGGSRGLAHIGVLDVLQKNRLVPDIITGTSMGAIIGGLFAAGYSGDRLKALAHDLNLNKYVEHLRPSFLKKDPQGVFNYLVFIDSKNRLLRRMGLVREDAFKAFLKGLVGDARIESLPIMFACNAIDLVSGMEVTFTRGKLSQALRATMSLPLVFAPARTEAMWLVDGGILNNAPVDTAREMGAKVVVLVDVHRPLKKMPPGGVENVFQVLQRIVDITRANANEKAAGLADLVLRVALDTRTLDFSGVKRTIREGELCAATNLESVRELVH